MANDGSGKRLGRGLAALIGEMDRPAAAPTSSGQEEPTVIVSDRRVPIESIAPNPSNPRRTFPGEELADLAVSISEHGIVQPILVRSAPAMVEQDWEIIAGERRWRAAQQAGLDLVPIIVRDVDDRQALELAIIENVQRSDLNPVEEAAGYQQLLDDHGYSQADLGKVIGKSRSHVANTLRLLKLPAKVQEMLGDGSLSSGHARALITLDDPLELAQKIVREGLSVREAERLAGELGSSPGGSAKARSGTASMKDPETANLERRLSDAIGMKVTIDHKPSGKGRLAIRYASLEQLDLLEQRLGE